MLAGYQPFPLNQGRGTLFCAALAVTALPAYTATALAGPMLYNGSGNKGVNAQIVSFSFGITTAASAAAAIGIVGGATTAPTSTSTTGLITSCTELRSGAPSPKCTVYAAGTVSVAGTLWMPTGQVGTAALTAEIADDNFIHLGGVITVAPGYFAAPAASATLSTAVAQLCITWLEVPIEA